MPHRSLPPDLGPPRVQTICIHRGPTYPPPTWVAPDLGLRENASGACEHARTATVRRLHSNQLLRVLRGCVLGCLLTGGAMERAHAQAVDTTLWATDGTVSAISRFGGKVYLGGSFSAVGPVTGSFVPVDALTGAALASFPRVAGDIYAAIPDGSGGWFIGGDFHAVGGVPRTNLAHIRSDLTVSDWNPSTSREVLSLLLSGSTLYVGGLFTSVNGVTRNRIAAIDASTGGVTPWNPNAQMSGDAPVYALAISGSTIYAGGIFNAIGGQPRNCIAALSATTGQATAWTPITSGPAVYDIEVKGDTILVGGWFSTMGGQPRNNVAALRANNGQALSWNPNVAGTVSDITLTGTQLLIGGDFFAVAGVPRNSIASVDATTGALASWNPSCDGVVWKMLATPSTVYVGGSFGQIGGQPRRNVAAIDASTGSATSWNPGVGGDVLVLQQAGSAIWVGGWFYVLGLQARENLAALDAASGTLLPWNPAPSNDVLAIEGSGQNLYVGGAFTSIGGQPRNRIAALDTVTGAATAWDPNAIGTVRALDVFGSVVYLGGDFGGVDGHTRSRIAAVDIATGHATPWNPGASGSVRALVATGDKVFAGGSFATIGAATRNRIAALDASSGNATPWDPALAGSIVNTLLLHGSVLYAGGDFSSIGVQPRSRIAALDTLTGAATAWNPGANGSILDIAALGSTVYVGGQMDSVGGQRRVRLAAIHATTGTVLDWRADVIRGGMNTLSMHSSSIYVGGGYFNIGVHPRGSAARIAGVPELFTVIPSTGGDVEVATLSLTGVNLLPGATVRLTRSGQPDIPGTSVAVSSDGASLSAMFDLQAVANGAWSVVLTNPDAQTATLVNAFTVESVAAPALRVEILGPAQVRANYPVAYDLVVENQGNVDAVGVPLWLAGLPSDAVVTTDFTLSAVPSGPGEPDWSQAPITLAGAVGR